MRGYYPGGGINIGPAIVFAYIAVRHVAEDLATTQRPIEASTGTYSR